MLRLPLMCVVLLGAVSPTAVASTYVTHFTVPSPVAAGTQLGVDYQVYKDGNPSAVSSLTLGLTGPAQFLSTSWSTSYPSGTKTTNGATDSAGRASARVEFPDAGSIGMCGTVVGQSASCLSAPISVVATDGVQPFFTDTSGPTGTPLEVTFQVVGHEGAVAATASFDTSIAPSSCHVTPASAVTAADGTARATVSCESATVVLLCAHIGANDGRCGTIDVFTNPGTVDAGVLDAGSLDAGASLDGGAVDDGLPAVKLSWVHASDAGIHPGAQVQIAVNLTHLPTDAVLTLGEDGLQGSSLCRPDGTCLTATDGGYLLPFAESSNQAGEVKLTLSSHAIAGAGGSVKIDASLRTAGFVSEDSVELPVEAQAVSLGCSSAGGVLLGSTLPALAWLARLAGNPRRASRPGRRSRRSPAPPSP